MVVFVLELSFGPDENQPVAMGAVPEEILIRACQAAAESSVVATGAPFHSPGQELAPPPPCDCRAGRWGRDAEAVFGFLTSDQGVHASKCNGFVRFHFKLLRKVANLTGSY
jgi:hypothetical protein